MTITMRTSAQAFLLALTCVAAAACGGGNAEMSLAGPTLGSTPSATSGATITGRINSGSGLAQTTSSVASTVPITPSSTHGITVSVAGTGISTQVDGRGLFTLSGVPSGPVQLQFSGPGVSATISITVNGAEQIQIAVTVNGSSAHIESEHRSGSNNRGELVGRITEIDPAARTLRVSGTLVLVPPDAIIRHGSRVLQFAELLTGDHVEVRGTMEGTTLRASEVKVQSDGRGELTEREGVVSELTGACPELNFKLGTTRVKTDGSTYFKEGACAQVVNGASVEVKGRPQADGSLVAVRVDVEHDDDEGDDDDGMNEAKVEGLVSGLSGGCPAPSFTVNNTRVTTSATTRFEGGCAAIQNGVEVEVYGVRQADGSIAATKVEIEEAKIEGVVSALTGSCPAPSFTVNTTKVTTSAATRFDGGCPAVQNGRRVEVRGMRQPDGSIAASRVKVNQ